MYNNGPTVMASLPHFLIPVDMFCCGQLLWNNGKEWNGEGRVSRSSETAMVCEHILL